MSEEISGRLYELLPAIYRIKDAQEGEPQRALIALLEREAKIVEEDISRLYDNWFIETCDEWAVPYIGDLLGIRGMHPAGTSSYTTRPYVANTLAYRRRKGTITAIEQLARDVTGWVARAVEFFALLALSQNLNHIRPNSLLTIDLRDLSGLENIGGPFEHATHSGEVRLPAAGRYNIPNIGIFLWRLQSYPVKLGEARKISDGLYSFSPLENNACLFNLAQTEEEIFHLACEENVPGPIRPLAFEKHIEGYYGPNKSLKVIKDGNIVPSLQIMAMDLSGGARPPAGKVAIDVKHGRIAFHSGEEPTDAVEVDYAYGFSGDIGGGPYNRQESLDQAMAKGVSWIRGVRKKVKPEEMDFIYDNLSQAVKEWNKQPPGTRGIIAILESCSLDESQAPGEGVNIEIPAGSSLIIAAAGLSLAEAEMPRTGPYRSSSFVANDLRPHLIADIFISGTAPVNKDPGELVLNGLLIQGTLSVSGNLGLLQIAHSTLVPGKGLKANGEPVDPDLASIKVSGNELLLEIDHSITGPLRLPSNMAGLNVSDSIIDSPRRDGRAKLYPALLSGKLDGTINLSALSPSLWIKIGEEGPYLIKLSQGSRTLAEIRSLLEAAIHSISADPGIAFKNASVILIEDRLLILPGLPVEVKIYAQIKDSTAHKLKLDETSAANLKVLVSGILPSFSGMSTISPALDVRIGDIGPLTISLEPKPMDLNEARERIEDALRRAHNSKLFKSSIVSIVKDRLVVITGIVSGQMTPPVLFSSSPNDPTSLTDLALECEKMAISASDDGILPGPKTKMERTTVIGSALINELAFASEVIFCQPVFSIKRQMGCVRFSYVPDGSRTPQSYRCQPDLALAGRAEELNMPVEKLSQTERDQIVSRIRPAFTSARYGDPGYAQLSHSSPREIKTGAEDGSEMGVFCYLKQPQREANLRSVLDEYLRFGLEAGILYIT
ncbi:hypothetical protein [Methanothrix soehngenii]|uniref:hypothetical protein n=1 Tax=Methanothrix soehngenii TaxID=2223 RepID=UPI002CBEB82B|nr:hypothetical protein [Methanothrix soehngenii]HOS22419.1 hypothetical protein [Methanothrix soehngenii]HPL20787.1 hypothetical protein [Methanothrix soehngenii]